MLWATQSKMQSLCFKLIRIKQLSNHFFSVGAMGAGAAGGLAMKSVPVLLALKGASVLAFVSVGAPAAVVGLGGFFLYQGFNKVAVADDLKNDLEKLEIMRIDLIKRLEALHEATKEQERAIDNAKNILTRISGTCNIFGGIKGYVLNKEQIKAFDYDINSIINNYDKMIAFFNLFEKDLQENQQKKIT